MAMCQLDSATGVVVGDEDSGVGEFDDRLADLRLPADRVRQQFILPR